jgi:pyrroline-5-carboxylate reductase
MCEAVVGGLIKNNIYTKDEICYSNPSTPRLEIMKQKFGTKTFGGPGSNIEVVRRS